MHSWCYANAWHVKRSTSVHVASLGKEATLFTEVRGIEVLGSSDAASCIASGPMPLVLRRAYNARGGGGCSGDEQPTLCGCWWRRNGRKTRAGLSRMPSSVLVGEPVVCNLDGVAADMACRADFWYLIGGLGPLLNVMYFPKYSMLIAVIVRASQGCRPGFLFHCHSRSLLYEDCYRASVCTIHPTSRKRDSRKSEYQRLPKRSLICVIRSLDSASNLRTLHVAVGHHMKGQDS
jgi:hypothetical protein